MPASGSQQAAQLSLRAAPPAVCLLWNFFLGDKVHGNMSPRTKYSVGIAKKVKQKFASFEIICTFAFPFEGNIFWRVGRVVECGGLENR